ncbi:hypothetical protein BJX76DRAFT_354028 [Aspergillus varians]
MDPGIQEIITRFKLLGTTSARRIAYHQIIDQLGPHEWRDVKKRINGRSFQKDILGALPLEIAVQIIQYLNLDDAHLLRRVSRRWYDVLSSNLACSVLFRLYTGGSLNNLGGDFKTTLARHSRQRLRLEQGNPLKGSQINLPFVTGQEILSLDYSDGRYAWSTDGDTTIVVYDLCTRKTQRFCTSNRERLAKIRISEYIVAAISTRGYCHAWDLRTEEIYTVRLPNMNISVFAISGFRIVISFRNLCIEGQTSSAIMHYDLQSGRTHTLQHLQELAFVGFSSSSQRLTTISLEEQENREGNDASSCPHLCIVNYELLENGDASVARSHTLELPLPRDWALLDAGIRYDLQDDCKNGMAVLYARPALGISARECILPITYHPQTEEIYVHTLLEHQIARPLCMANVDKGILYWIRNEDGKRNIWISNPYADTPLYASRSMTLGLPRDPSDGASLFIHTYRVLAGDSRFVSMIDATGTRVWSFEGETQLGDIPIAAPI